MTFTKPKRRRFLAIVNEKDNYCLTYYSNNKNNIEASTDEGT